LMLAQRFPEAMVEAVEIDESASATANKNFQSSAFKERLQVHNMAIEQFNNEKQFDLIISNPPFFVNDLKNAEEKKGIARHASEQFFIDLITKVNELLTQNGCFWFVLPLKQASFLVEIGQSLGLYAHKIIHLHSDETKSAFRQIVCLSRAEVEVENEHFYIYQQEKVYTEAYKTLLAAFFLGY
ncbi:MAG: tRNA methyltransferase, partial [Chitinophagaceae bacterium]